MDFVVVFNKNLTQKNGTIGWGPGPVKGDQNFQSHRGPPLKKKKIFFPIQPEDLLNP